MEHGTNLLFLFSGLVLLVFGGEGLVRGSAALARRLRVSSLVVGLTVVAFGTSAPELVVSVGAALRDSGDIALGNVVGSNIANVLLILGLAALIRPLAIQAQVLRVDIPILIGVSVAVVPLLWNGRVGRAEGALLFAGIVAYTVLSVVLARRESARAVLEEYDKGVPATPGNLAVQLVLIAGGLALLVGGANLFVGAARRLAQSLGVSEALIGLTIVAVGTSLPELMTSLIAAVRRENDIAVGNVVGSNIFNLLGILGASACVKPLRAEGIDAADYVVMLLAALVLLPLAWSGRRLDRREAVLLLAGYAAYVGLRATYGTG